MMGCRTADDYDDGEDFLRQSQGHLVPTEVQETFVTRLLNHYTLTLKFESILF